MLEKIDKIAPYLALLVLGYLCHSVMSSGAAARAQAKDAPLITAQILHPELVALEARVSPANRDPFDVRWASYRDGSGLGRNPATPGEPESPTTSPASPDSEEALPPLPTGLKGLLLADDVQFVVVGDKICRPGDPVSGDDPSRSWVVERVDVDGVMLKFGNVHRKIELITDKTHPPPTSAPSEDNGL